MTYIILSLVAGGVARAFVGTGLGPKWLGRWSVYPPVAAVCAYIWIIAHS
jgi:hypothetical protein